MILDDFLGFYKILNDSEGFLKDFKLLSPLKGGGCLPLSTLKGRGDGYHSPP